MKNNKLFIFILSLMLIIAGIFISCESDAPDPGTVNQGLYPFFKIDDNGKLVIVSGAGIKNLVIPGTVQTSSGNKQVIFDGFVSADDKNALESVTVGAGVQGIGDGAFSGAGNLSNVTFEKGSSLESIGSGAFQGTGITGIDIPSSVTSIDNNAFADTPKLESVGLGANITTQGDASNIFGDNVKHVTIKGDGKGNETVGNMFSGKDKLESVTITEGVTTINSGAFQNDSSLSKVELPSTLTTIGDNAFTSISPDASITLPYATTNVANSTFDQATTLYRTLRFFQMKDSSVYRDATVKIQPAPVAIDSFLIEKANEFKAVLAPSANFKLDAILNYSGDTIYAYAQEDDSFVTQNCIPAFPAGAHGNDIVLSWIDANVKYEPVKDNAGNTIGYSVSLNDPLVPAGTTEVSISSTYRGKPVLEIADGAFSNSNVKVDFPSGTYEITTIGKDAFNGNTSLTEDILAKMPDVTTVEDGAFSNTGLTEATIPSGLNKIPASMFEGSSNLSKLNPENALDGVTSIGDKAFAGTGLTELTIPGSVTDIGTGAFAGMDNLGKVVIDNNIVLTDKNNDGRVFDDFISAFDKPSSVKELTIPPSLWPDTEAEWKQFNEVFKNVETLIVPDQTGTSTDNVIGPLSNIDFNDLQKVDIGSGVILLPGTPGTANPPRIDEIEITTDTLGEGNNPFAGVEIGKVTINPGEGDKTIITTGTGNGIILDNAGDIVIGDGITEIQQGGLTGMGPDNKVHTITLPDSVTTVAEGAFDDEDIIIFNITFTNYFNASEYPNGGYGAGEDKKFEYKFKGNTLLETKISEADEFSGYIAPKKYGYDLITPAEFSNMTIGGLIAAENRVIELGWKAKEWELEFKPGAVNARAGFVSPEDITVTFDQPVDTKETILDKIKSANPNYGYSFNEITNIPSGLEFGAEKLIKELTPTTGEKISLEVTRIANTYTVKFDGNGSTKGSMPNQGFKYDTAQALTTNAYERTGYTFAGWSDKADGTGNAYTDGASVNNLVTSGEITLYAKWTPNTYTVQFDGNDSDGGADMTNQTFTYDVAQSLTENAYAKKGHTFAGWSDKADGTGNAYADEESVINLATSGEITLYAQWSPINYTVVFKAVTGPAEQEEQIEFGEIVNISSIVTKFNNNSGYVHSVPVAGSLPTGIKLDGDYISIVEELSSNSVNVDIPATPKEWTLKFVEPNGGFNDIVYSEKVIYGKAFPTETVIKNTITAQNSGLDLSIQEIKGKDGKVVTPGAILNSVLDENGEEVIIYVNRMHTLSFKYRNGDVESKKYGLLTGTIKVPYGEYTFVYPDTNIIDYTKASITNKINEEGELTYINHIYFKGFENSGNYYNNGDSITVEDNDMSFTVNFEYEVYFCDADGNRLTGTEYTPRTYLIGTLTKSRLIDLPSAGNGYHWDYFAIGGYGTDNSYKGNFAGGSKDVNANFSGYFQLCSATHEVK